MGLCVGDALGVPVQFEPRKTRKSRPVTDMIGHGTFNLPPGTWSDDSSLTFCLAESLCSGMDLSDIGRHFVRWLYGGHWTPFGYAFDIGQTTAVAVERIKKGIPPLEAGGKAEDSNGNGSLMRILPLTFYLAGTPRHRRMGTVHAVSCLTHAHLRSQMACGIYIELAVQLLGSRSIAAAYRKAAAEARRYYAAPRYRGELHHFARVLDARLKNRDSAKIRSSGYVVATREAAVWCLLTSRSYRETVLKAVNLGEDTDTTAAVAGGLAGIVYGPNAIPREWLNQIPRRSDIVNLADALYNSIAKKGAA